MSKGGGYFFGFQCPVCGVREENPEPVPLEDIAARVGALMYAEQACGVGDTSNEPCSECADKKRAETTQ